MSMTKEIDLTTAKPGGAGFDPASDDWAPSGGRRWYVGGQLPERSYPSGCSSYAGPALVLTPFGRVIVDADSFGGSATFGPLPDYRMRQARDMALATGAPMLTKDMRGRAILETVGEAATWAKPLSAEDHAAADAARMKTWQAIASGQR